MREPGSQNHFRVGYSSHFWCSPGVKKANIVFKNCCPAFSSVEKEPSVGQRGWNLLWHTVGETIMHDKLFRRNISLLNSSRAKVLFNPEIA